MIIEYERHAECMLYTGKINPRGYGVVWQDGRAWAVHRLVYGELVAPLRDDQRIRHTCKNRGCVNVQHMEIMPKAKPYVRKPARTHCKHGHLLDDANLYVTKQGWKICRRCKLDYVNAKNARQRAKLKTDKLVSDSNE